MKERFFGLTFFLVFVFVSSFIFFEAQSVSAALKLKLVSGAAAVEIEDNMAGDAEPTIGLIVFNGSIDTFVVAVVTGVSKPIVGNETLAQLNLSAVTTASSSGGNLVISLTDTDYGPGSGDTTVSSAIGGTTNGITTFQSYLDPANNEFGISGTCTSGLQGPFGSGAFDDTTSGGCSLSGSFSLTAVAEVMLGAGQVQSFGSVTQAGIPTIEEIGCRFTGGGVDTDLNWNHVLEDGETIRNGAGNLPEGIDRYQFGGQVGARTAQQPQPSGEWQHHQQTGPSGSFSFHGGTSSAADGTRIVDIRCSDPGFCFPARPAPAKQLDFDGIGTFSNVGKGSKAPIFDINASNVIPEPANQKSVFTFHWFEVNIDDLGEPGRLNIGAPGSDVCPGRGFGEKSDGPYVPDPVISPDTTVILTFTELADCDCPDFYRITIYQGVLSTEVTYLPDGRIDPSSLNQSDVIYAAFGYIDGGNLQIHPPTGYDR